MPEWWTSSVGPLAPIVAALVSAGIGAAITFLFTHKRKRLAFTIRKSEDLTSPLRQHHGLISFRFGLREVSSLNRAVVRVRNTGNTTIKDVKFDITLFGSHPFYLSEVSLRDPAMVRGIKTERPMGDSSNSPALNVTADFLNPKESFEILIYFDGEVEQPDVYCRMEEVKIIKRQGEMGETMGQVFLEALQKWTMSFVLR
jgi:hypothetical protein